MSHHQKSFPHMRQGPGESRSRSSSGSGGHTKKVIFLLTNVDRFPGKSGKVRVSS